MLRCGQMIFAQALTCRHLGRGQSMFFFFFSFKAFHFKDTSLHLQLISVAQVKLFPLQDLVMWNTRQISINYS